MDRRAENTLNILLVEDDAHDVASVRRAFQKANIVNPMWVASDGVEALDMLRGHEFPRERRLMLLDIDLPKLDGVEVLRQVRKDEQLRDICVVVLARSNEDRYRTEAHDLDVNGYLLKPVTAYGFFDLMATLNHCWTAVEAP